MALNNPSPDARQRPDGPTPDPGLDQDGLEEVPSHRNDLGDHCPYSGSRSADGTCPLSCHEADVLVGFDAGDRGLPESTDLEERLWPPYCADELRARRERS